MKLRLALAIAAATVAAPAVAPAQPGAAQPDWSRTVAATPEGGFRMGNPDAPVKLVEYLSLTCPHCAQFSESAVPYLIANYVRSGRVSLEYRNYVLNGPDLAASFLSRCAAPADYFALNHALLSSQAQWTGRIEALTADQRRQMVGLRPIEALGRIVTFAGLDAIAARHGVSAAEARACLADQAALDRLVEIKLEAASIGIRGTPSFAINGRVAENVHDWESLEPLLRAAVTG